MKKKSLLQKYGGGMGMISLIPNDPCNPYSCFEQTTKATPTIAKITGSGKILDDQNMPLEGANVYLQDNTSKGTVTNTAGTFALPDLNPSDIVVLSYIGFESQTYRADSIPPTIQLEPNVEIIPGVTVTAKQKKNLQIAGWALLGTLIIFAFAKRDKKKKEAAKTSASTSQQKAIKASV